MTWFLFIFLTLLSSQEILATKPHIVFILVNDLGWNDVGFHGSPQIATPNIDALAFSGMILQNYYVLPISTPSRSALMTGKHPIHTGLQHDSIYYSTGYGLPLSLTIMPGYLKPLGYANHIVGNWHLGFFKSTYTPTFRGFDSHYGPWGAQQDYTTHVARDGIQSTFQGYDMRSNLAVDWSANGTYTTRLLTKKATSVIASHNPSTPLFLYVSHVASQSIVGSSTPLQAPVDTQALFSSITDTKRRLYAAMVYELDDSVGKIVQALSSKSMLNNTIIVFSTANGGAANGSSNNAASNWPLKGVKNTPWEGGVRAAGFIWSPLIPSNRRRQVMNGLMDISDWLPTLYEAAGGNSSNLGTLDGYSQWQTILNGAPSSRTNILHNIDDVWGYSAVRQNNLKLVKGTTNGGRWDGWYGPSPQVNPSTAFDATNYEQQLLSSDVGQSLSSVAGMTLPTNMTAALSQTQVTCTKPASAVACSPLVSACLFDISQDPCEYNNLAAQQPSSVTALLALIQQYRLTAVSPLNTRSDKNSNPKNYNNTWTNWSG